MAKEIIILRDANHQRLQEEIQGLLNDGFEIYGNLVVVYDPQEDRFWHYQEVIK